MILLWEVFSLSASLWLEASTNSLALPGPKSCATLERALVDRLAARSSNTSETANNEVTAADSVYSPNPRAPNDAANIIQLASTLCRFMIACRTLFITVGNASATEGSAAKRSFDTTRHPTGYRPNRGAPCDNMDKTQKIIDKVVMVACLDLRVP